MIFRAFSNIIDVLSVKQNISLIAFAYVGKHTLLFYADLNEFVFPQLDSCVIYSQSISEVTLACAHQSKLINTERAQIVRQLTITID